MAEKHAFEKHQHQIRFLPSRPRPRICTRALRCGRNFVEGLRQPKENRDLVVGVKRRAKTLDADGASLFSVNAVKDRPAQLPGLPTFTAGHPDHSLEVEFPSLLLGLGVVPPLPFVILGHLCLLCLTVPLQGVFYLILCSLSGTCQCIVVVGRSGSIRCRGLVLASTTTKAGGGGGGGASRSKLSSTVRTVRVSPPRPPLAERMAAVPVAAS